MRKSIYLALTMLFLCCGKTSATDYEVIGGLKYLIDTDKREATIVANYYSGSISVPESVTANDGLSYPVVAIGDECFKGCSTLKSITMPATIKTIGNSAFAKCTKLESLDFPVNVTSIGAEALDSCTSLRSVCCLASTPPTLTSLGYIYEYCSLTTLPSVRDAYSNNKSWSNSFKYFSERNYINRTIGSNMYNFYLDTFEATLIYCEMGNSDIVIPEKEFYCGLEFTLTSINLQDQNYSGDYVFKNYAKIKSVVLPNTIKELGYRTFYRFRNLKSITLPPNLEHIGELCFADCSLLDSIVIPASVKTIERAAFASSSNLCIIKFEGTTPPDVQYNSIYRDNDAWFRLNKSSCIVYIPASVSEKYNNLWGSFDLLLCPYDGTSSPSMGIIEKGQYRYLYDETTQEARLIHKNSYNSITTADIDQSVLVNGINIPVTQIANECFNECTNLRTLKIPSSIVTIGNSSFSGCTNLENVSLSDKLETMGNNSFSGCSKLASLSIPESVSSIGKYAFYECSSLNNIIIPQAVKMISLGCFRGCTNLSNLQIPTTIESIEGAFINKTAIESFVIPNCIDTLYSSFFEGCSSLKKVQIPSTVTIMDQNAFSDCSSLTNLEIPTSVIEFGEGCFKNCTGFTKLSIPAYVEKIGDKCFNGCTNLQEITCYATTPPELGKSQNTSNCNLYVPMAYVSAYRNNSTWYEAFQNIAAIGSVNVVNGIKYSFDFDTQEATVMPNDYSGDIVIPEKATSNDIECTVVKIGNNAFSEDSTLTSVVIPATVKSIGEKCFYGCKALSIVEIPLKTSSLVEIGSYGFALCSNLCSISLPEGVEKMGDYCFWNCEKLKEFTFPQNISSIGADCFNSCDSLEYVKLLSESVTKIPLGCFGSCKRLKNIDMPSQIRRFEDYSFANCESLSAITLPSSLTYLGQYCLLGTSIESFEVPSRVTDIGMDAFGSCKKLKEIVINANITKLDAYMFSNCDSLRSVSLPSTLTTLDQGCFLGCHSLKSINIPNSVTIIDRACFQNCDSLEQIKLPSNLTYLGVESFSGCSSLTEFTIPQTVTSLGRACLDNDYKIAEIKCYAATVPSRIFDYTSMPMDLGVNKAYSVLYVPKTSLNDYKSKSWAKMKYICALEDSATSIREEHIDNMRYFVIPDEKSAAVLPDNYSGSIIIPSSVSVNGETYTVKGIADKSFFKKEVSDVTIPSTVDSLGNNAFKDVIGLKEIKCMAVTPPSVDSLGVDGSNCILYVPFESLSLYKSAKGWNNIDNIKAYNQPESFDAVIDGINYHLNFISKQAEVIKYNYSGNVSIPQSVQFNDVEFDVVAIAERALEGQENLKSVKSSASIKSIGNNAFANSANLQTVALSSVETIGDSCFANNAKLKDVELPSTLATIGSYMFSDCKSLSNAVIPNSVKSIGKGIFKNCTSLSNVSLSEQITTIPEESFFRCYMLIDITLPQGVTSLEKCAFKYCASLSSISMPDSLKNIGDSCFCECNSIIDMQLPEFVERIGNASFYNCTSLDSIRLKENVKYVGQDCFKGTDNLKGIRCDSEIPPTATVVGANVETCYLIVANNALNSYKEATGWKDFYHIYTLDQYTGIESISVDGSFLNSIYDLNGRKRFNLKSGINIINGKKILIK